MLEESRAKLKWENDEYICRGHVLNAMSDVWFDIYQNIPTANFARLWRTGCSIPGNSKQVDVMSDVSEVVEYVEAESSELIGKVVNSDVECYELYNDYAFRKGFGIRYGKLWRDEKNGIRSRGLTCHREGFKRVIGKEGKKYTKIDKRCGCNARIMFKHMNDDRWVVTLHHMVHNHDRLDPDEVHLARSHRIASLAHLKKIEELSKSGMKKAQAYRHLRDEAHGSPLLGFMPRDVYNGLAKRRNDTMAECDAQTLINVFKEKIQSEDDFFYDYVVDDQGHLESFFWRDSKMKSDYMLFGDLVVFDTTYRTNRYNLVCAPFVSMNHHTRNIMVGCGFLNSEKIGNFIWLFNTFLNAMSNVHPQTIMTDQDFAMANAIRRCFPTSCHRLCTWHISENSRTYLSQLRMKPGFIDLFDYVLRRCDTEAEFEVGWKRFVEYYKCADNDWLKRLYSIKHKWCPAFSKEKFSGGVLSSQRSESLNSSIARNRCATSKLTEFYDMLCRVIKEWRRTERDDHVLNKEGYPEILVPGNSILMQAVRIYTIKAYKVFEHEFVKGLSCKQKLVSSVEISNGREFVYHVFEHRNAIVGDFGFIVKFQEPTCLISCDCKNFEEAGFLCSHILRILMIHCVEKIHERYFIKRWSRNARLILTTTTVDGPSRALADVSDFWLVQIRRKYESIFVQSQEDPRCRDICEKMFKRLRDAIEMEVGMIDIPENEESGRDKILNPVSKRKKGQRNVRLKSIAEKAANLTRARKSRSQTSLTQNQSIPEVCNISNITQCETTVPSYYNPMDFYNGTSQTVSTIPATNAEGASSSRNLCNINPEGQSMCSVVFDQRGSQGTTGDAFLDALMFPGSS